MNWCGSWAMGFKLLIFSELFYWYKMSSPKHKNISLLSMLSMLSILLVLMMDISSYLKASQFSFNVSSRSSIVIFWFHSLSMSISMTISVSLSVFKIPVNEYLGLFRHLKLVTKVSVALWLSKKGMDVMSGRTSLFIYIILYHITYRVILLFPLIHAIRLHIPLTVDSLALGQSCWGNLAVPQVSVRKPWLVKSVKT